MRLVIRRSKLLLGLVLATLLIAIALLVWSRWPRALLTEQFGPIRAFPAWLRQNGIAFVFSGAEGWSRDDEQAARSLARAGNFVAGLDTPELIRHLNQLKSGCIFMPGILEDYSHVQQRAAGTMRFEEPALLGRGSGAALVYLAQIQAPALAFRAAVMLDPEPELPLRAPVCDHPALRRDDLSQQLRPEPLGGNVATRLWLDEAATAAARAFAAAVTSPPAMAPAVRSLRRVYASALGQIEADQLRGGVADLPLVEVPASRPTHELFAILYSGDGGWRDLDRTLADVLASKGVNVVGVDVLRYFWRRRSPELGARDLARIMHHYQQLWQSQQVVLIGFSFGADVLPFLVSRLPAGVRANVRLLTLLSPERETAFEVEPSGWLGMRSSGPATLPVEPELKKMPQLRVQCIFGADEAAGSLCTAPLMATHEVVRKAGGHHFDENYGALADAIIAAAAH
ncbi:MAG: AcvB/VirJ family lysyl-phosphatidylglycerol hydrolase [Steroidobacteraceae bacterium]|jgi:type IV secretory pathway VirJ component